MTVRDVFELRKQGRIEDAYDAIRPLYANDKGAYTSTAMFWTATDILKKRLNEGRTDEAEKIFAALERMLPNVPEKRDWLKGHSINVKNGCKKDVLLVTSRRVTSQNIYRQADGEKNSLSTTYVRRAMSFRNATGTLVIGISMSLHKRMILLCSLK